MTMQPIRTLVLSGGGGRGAFHAGVYQYLNESAKAGIDEEHRGTWTPEIVVGTSIGAVNGAAIVQGTSADKLADIWLNLREHHIEGIPPGMQFVSRTISNWLYKKFLGVTLPVVPPEKATSPAASESWPPLPLMPRALSEKLIGRWNNLLDTGPLLETLKTRLNLSREALESSSQTLLINATNIRTGERITFSNHPVLSRKTGQPRDDVRVGITPERIVASCSIPLIYPWTQDSEDGEVYWDGAVVANTPLGAALDAVSDRPIEQPMEVLVVLLNPWWERGEEMPRTRQKLPQDFGEAITWALDWALLASFRERLQLTEMCNEECRRDLAAGREPTYRMVNVVIIDPEDFLPVTRIIDYDEPASRKLIDLGYKAAARAFQKAFASGKEKP
jgi:NTE family protein